MEQLPKGGLVRGPCTKHTWELRHLLSPWCNWNSAHFILLDAPRTPAVGYKDSEHLLWDILIRKPDLWGDSWGMLGIVNEHCGTGTTLPETNIAPGFICLSFDYKWGDQLKTAPFGYGLKKNVRYIFHAKVLHDVHSDALITFLQLCKFSQTNTSPVVLFSVRISKPPSIEKPKVQTPMNMKEAIHLKDDIEIFHQNRTSCNMAVLWRTPPTVNFLLLGSSVTTIHPNPS